MSKDTIYRQAAIDAVEESRRLNHHQDGKKACAHEYEHRHFLKILMDLPSAQPERKKGKWIRTRTMTHDGELYCDQCEQEHPEQKIIWNFCPNCGASMEEGDSDD